ncbi:MAG: hypothetical protein AAFV88_25625 [Planctomycetota bacterium]
MNALSANTPCDVLLDDNQRLGPKLMAHSSGVEYKAIYAFSSKKSYDLFCNNSDQPLIPYPLVKGYLKNQIADSVETVQLVVIDAEGPQQARMNAATMNSVLDAVEQKADQVGLSFHLTLDQETETYCIE